MRAFLMLLRREAREMRTVSVVLAVVAPLALLVYEELGAHYVYPQQTVQWVIPVIASLVVATLGADVVAADVATRRIDALAALPVRPGTIWRAKLAFIVLAAIATAGMLAASSLVLYQLRAPSDWIPALYAALSEYWFCSLAALPIAFGVLAFSTATSRGFAAGLAGVLTVGGAAAGACLLDYRHYELFGVIQQLRVAIPVIVALLLLAGSYIAFTRGPAHAGSTLRRATLVLALPLIIAAPGAALALAAAKARIDLIPGAAGVALDCLTPAPDGSRIAMVARNPGQRSSRVWIVDLDDGSLADVPGKYSRLGLDPWQDDGTLSVWEYGFGHELMTWPDTVQLIRWIDPATGAIEKTRSRGQFLSDGGRLSRRFAAPTSELPWHAHLTYRQVGDGFQRELMWQGVSHVLPTNTQFLADPGWVVLADDDGDVAWKDLGSGDVRVRVETHGRTELWPFQDATTLLIVDGPERSRRVRLFSREDGRLTGGPWDWPKRASTTLRRGQAALNGWLVLLGAEPGLWNPQTGARIALTGASAEDVARLTGWSGSAQLSGNRIAIAINGGLRVYDTTSGALLRRYIRDVD